MYRPASLIFTISLTPILMQINLADYTLNVFFPLFICSKVDHMPKEEYPFSPKPLLYDKALSLCHFVCSTVYVMCVRECAALVRVCVRACEWK